MKITNVYTEKYKWPKEKPIANGTHVFTHNELNLLVIEIPLVMFVFYIFMVRKYLIQIYSSIK